jgi:ubiquinone/menaquinone biosynthesis C-methylase UbiE
VTISTRSGVVAGSLTRLKRRVADTQLGRRSRDEYKATWTVLAATSARATEHVIGRVSEDELRASARETCATLEQLVGVRAGDVVLEIGCGIGRVGEEVAPRCREWIGCDVSPAMLGHAGRRLAALPNVRLVEVSGFDLEPIPSASVDMVYCTVVFMHLDEWDRYAYVLEAKRVLRPGGRLFVDNFTLTTDDGWKVFEDVRLAFPRRRPAHVSKASTPDELLAYLARAGFEDVRASVEGAWVRCAGSLARERGVPTLVA